MSPHSLSKQRIRTKEYIKNKDIIKGVLKSPPPHPQVLKGLESAKFKNDIYSRGKSDISGYKLIIEILQSLFICGYVIL